MVRGVACLLGSGFVMRLPGCYVQVVAVTLGVVWVFAGVGGWREWLVCWVLVCGVSVRLVMCERWLAHSRLSGHFDCYVQAVAGTLWLCGVLGWWWGSGSGCFLRLFVFGECRWVGYVRVVAVTLGVVWVFAGVGGWREWLVRWILASWCFSVGSLCASGGWHIGGSEGLFGPGSGLFAGVRFCDVSVGVVMCKRRLTYWGAGIRFGRLCVSGGWHISAPVGASPCTLGV